jgi:C4-dicarboxylate-specific signal transduction histidine kinase
VQATPLFGRRGEPLGMIVTHFRRPHRPPERDLRLTDLHARQAAEIIERRLAEEALRRTQAELAHVARVTTLGELTGSLAHEVNQPLAAVVTNASACLRWLAGVTPNLDEARTAVERIIRDANRASGVIAHTRALLKKSVGEQAPLDVTELIRVVIVVIQPEVKRQRVVIRERLAENLGPVLAARVELQQVMLNLIVNGIEAMADVSDRPRELAVTSESQSLPNGRGVRVAVEDAGVGIDEERLDQLFEPFFTTKPHGLGMGLSICRSIVHAHGGRLWASRNAGHGTTFQFVLPCTTAPAR